MKTWLNKTPTNCDVCNNKIENVFYDAKTTYGPWGILCPTCFTLGPGLGKLGTGFGQKFEKLKDKWVKTGG